MSSKWARMSSVQSRKRIAWQLEYHVASADQRTMPRPFKTVSLDPTLFCWLRNYCLKSVAVVPACCNFTLFKYCDVIMVVLSLVSHSTFYCLPLTPPWHSNAIVLSGYLRPRWPTDTLQILDKGGGERGDCCSDDFRFYFSRSCWQIRQRGISDWGMFGFADLGCQNNLTISPKICLKDEFFVSFCLCLFY